MISANVPYVSRRHRINITNYGHGFHRVIAAYGFMQTPNVPEILEAATQQGLEMERICLPRLSMWAGKRS